MSKRFEEAVRVISAKIKELLAEKGSVRIAVDGNCGAGKTTFAKAVSVELDGNVFHMDDFYLPLENRTHERLNESGGNIHRERFLQEVLQPLKKGETVNYKVFNCKNQSFDDSVLITPKPVSIIEGSYSCHPDFYDYYDLHIFIGISPETQKERIINRNGKADWENFKKLWIPFEEKYFREFKIKEKCDIVFDFN